MFRLLTILFLVFLMTVCFPDLSDLQAAGLFLVAWIGWNSISLSILGLALYGTYCLLK
jgi:hypothetical protein